MVASTWLVFKLSHGNGVGYSASILGLTSFAQQIPILFLAPVVGVYADRMNSYRLLMLSQTLLMLLTLTIAFLALGGSITIGEVIVLNFLRGIVHSFDISAQQTLVVKLIDRAEDLPNAVALNSMMIQMARLVGPSLAGFMVYHFGESYCFLLDGLSYLAVLGCLRFVKVRHEEKSRHPPKRLAFKEAATFAWSFTPVRNTLCLVAVASLLYSCLTVFMPLIAVHIHDGGERILGLLYGACGLGASLSSFYLARRSSVVGLGKVMSGAAVAVGVGFLVLSHTEALGASLLALALTGSASILVGAISNISIQTLSEDEMRGRMMSFYSVALFGVAPLGSLMAGFLATHLGLNGSLEVGAACSILAGLWYYSQLKRMREIARPVLLRRGIVLPLPEQPN